MAATTWHGIAVHGGNDMAWALQHPRMHSFNDRHTQACARAHTCTHSRARSLCYSLEVLHTQACVHAHTCMRTRAAAAHTFGIPLRSCANSCFDTLYMSGTPPSECPRNVLAMSAHSGESVHT
eukprot:364759-Chlamydomonas_euryale.AAC.31